MTRSPWCRRGTTVVTSQIVKDIQSIGNPIVNISIFNSQIFKDTDSCSEKVTIQKLRDNVSLLKVLRKGKSWTQRHAFLEKRWAGRTCKRPDIPTLRETIVFRRSPLYKVPPCIVLSQAWLGGKTRHHITSWGVSVTPVLKGHFRQ